MAPGRLRRPCRGGNAAGAAAGVSVRTFSNYFQNKDLIGRSVDTLGYRGLTGWFQARGAVSPPRMLHFSMIPLDQAKVEGLGLQGMFIQQALTEEALTAIAAERGVRILRGREVTALAQDSDGVTVRVSGPDGDRRLRAGYVVGCDGGASVVRKHAGIGFPGIPPTFLLRLGDVTLTDGLTPQDIPGLRVPLVPLGGGYYRVVVTESYPDDLDRDSPMALDELLASIRRVNGTDMPIGGARWLSRFTDSSRLADSYRADRVLLAGDAAHIHLPAGGAWRRARVARTASRVPAFPTGRISAHVMA